MRIGRITGISGRPLYVLYLTGCEFWKSSSLLEVAEESCCMSGQCSKNARAKKPCDHLHFMPGCAPERHCQLIEKIPNKWGKYLTTDLLTPCIFVHECQGKS